MKILRILEIGWLVVAVFVSLLTLLVIYYEGFAGSDTWPMAVITAVCFVMYYFRRRRRQHGNRQEEGK